MRIGYARVSTKELQVDALRAAGCEKIYQKTASGARTERPELAELLRNLWPADVLVIWKLDRLGRSLGHLVEMVNLLNDKKVGLQSLNDPVDTATAQERLTFNLFASLAEFERDLIRKRTYAGLSAARARGRNGGRPKGISPHAETTAMAAETLYHEGQLSTLQIMNFSAPRWKRSATGQHCSPWTMCMGPTVNTSTGSSSNAQSRKQLSIPCLTKRLLTFWPSAWRLPCKSAST
ncbi:MAG TPA: recombinase family protein [Ktedonobacteraceae bacterium]